jgi:hypothetical protein
MVCLECGHKWKDLSVLGKTYVTCPNCNRRTRVLGDISWRDAAYIAKYDVVGRFQVIRMFFVGKYMRRFKPVDYSVTEVAQYWIGEEGKITVRSYTTQGQSMYVDAWCLSSELEIRDYPQNGAGYSRIEKRARIIPECVYPEAKFHPIIIRNGFTGKFYDIPSPELFTRILTSSHAETLLKTKQINLLKKFLENEEKIRKHWKSIKACIRNNYRVLNVNDWLDYLDNLEFFGKDLTNPKYVCPKDLKHEHDKYMSRKRKVMVKIKTEELKKTIAKDQKDFMERYRKFIGLLITDGTITVKPLKSVKEVLAEGELLNHCVFSNAYHKKAGYLLMGARIKNERIETIEFSLQRMEVVQSRGLNNQPTEFHNQIVQLVNSNAKQIEQLVKSK